VGKLTTVASDTTVEGGTYPKKYYFMAPGAHIEENFDFRKVMDDITGDAKKYIASKANKKNPFFLYFSLTAPHTPVMPAERFWGKGATGTLRHKHFDKGYPDFVYQVDDTVGEIMKTLDAQNVLEDTLIFFIADNGAAAKACNYLTMVNKGGHDPSGGLKGTKGSIYEGGHRVPFIVSWKNRIEPQVCDNLVGVTDLFATLAELVDYKYPDSAGEDSISFLPYLKGQTKGIREDFVTQSVVGDLAITEGNYKAIFTKAHGSWGQHHTIAGNPGLPKFQLYDLDNDLAETTNLYSEDGDSESNEILERLQKKLQQYILKGRSTPGAEQENYGDIVLFHNSSKVFEIQGFNKRQTDKHTKTYFMEHHSQETKSDEK
jgi:arylsulfatase A-like enzyme